MPTISADIEFEVTCYDCGKSLNRGINVSSSEVTVELCPNCKIYIKEEAIEEIYTEYNERIDRMQQLIEELETYKKLYADWLEENGFEKESKAWRWLGENKKYPYTTKPDIMDKFVVYYYYYFDMLYCGLSIGI